MKIDVEAFKRKQLEEQGGSLRNISRSQFMPITQLMRMPAADFAEHPVEHVFNGPFGPEERGHNRNYNWDLLRKQIGEQGIKEPLQIEHYSDGEPNLLNGHHRAMVAIEQGHLFVPVDHTEGY